MIFRAPFSRASRGLICLILAAGAAFALHAEITTPNIGAATRWGWAALTILMEVVLLGGLQRLWVVCLIVKDSDIVVRNFRGDIHYRPSEIKGVVRASDFTGFGVALRLKTGEDMRLDGLAWITQARTDRAVAEISAALGLAPAEVVADSA
ncbi:MAG TPA: hypothetical protein VHW74_07315 [Mycobacteriales bacterium]|nr:hypothetical protein [Mycobacteriales bacterium]